MRPLSHFFGYEVNSLVRNNAAWNTIMELRQSGHSWMGISMKALCVGKAQLYPKIIIYSIQDKALAFP